MEKQLVVSERENKSEVFGYELQPYQIQALSAEGLIFNQSGERWIATTGTTKKQIDDVLYQISSIIDLPFSVFAADSKVLDDFEIDSKVYTKAKSILLSGCIDTCATSVQEVNYHALKGSGFLLLSPPQGAYYESFLL